MKLTAVELTHQYAAAVRTYLAKEDEAALQRAYELGRQTVASGLGVMDLARAHSVVLLALLESQHQKEGISRIHNLASTFFQESLWAFEMLHRGFLEATRNLRELNAALESRARQLTTANEELTREISVRRQVEQALRRSEEELRLVSNQILYAQEEERKRISRELHDEVGQALTAINMNLTLVRKAAKSRDLARMVVDLQKALLHTMETVHSFTRELRPAMLEHLGLVPALRAYIRNFCKRTGLRVRFRAEGAVESLSLEEKTVLYRVTQEGLNNVAKHARVKRAQVIIRQIDGTIRMEIQDKGKAFRVEDKLKKSGKKRLGLLGIQERVRLVNGKFWLRSEPGQGTTIQVQIPFKNGGAKSN